MGEYITLDGRTYKIGTCESLYYVRYSDLVGWIDAGRAGFCDGNLQPKEYLAGSFRFRFPFPDEDGDEELRLRAYGREYARGVAVRADPELLEGVDHMDVTHWLRPKGVDVGGLNVFLPCPYGPQIDQVKHSPVGDLRYVSIVQQRPFDGCLWTVCGCPFCEALWRLPRDQAEVLAGGIVKDYPQARNSAELARRILEGYDMATASDM